MLERFNLNGKVAIVTGASRGMGKAMATAISEAGANVALVARDKKKLAEVSTSLPTTALSIPADLKEKGSYSKVLNQTIEKFKRLDILVCNAGMTIRSPSGELKEEDWDETLSLNLKSVVFLCQEAYPYLKESPNGKIIITASLMTFISRPHVLAYAASKSGLAGVIKTLACEWARDNICVNGITPGYIATDLTKPLLQDKKFNQWIEQRTPLARWGKPEDIQGLTVFLASEASNFITGAIVPCDGGFLASV